MPDESRSTTREPTITPALLRVSIVVLVTIVTISPLLVVSKSDNPEIVAVQRTAPSSIEICFIVVPART